jgi:hypothetical protein
MVLPIATFLWVNLLLFDGNLLLLELPKLSPYILHLVNLTRHYR